LSKKNIGAKAQFVSILWLLAKARSHRILIPRLGTPE